MTFRSYLFSMDCDTHRPPCCLSQCHLAPGDKQGPLGMLLSCPSLVFPHHCPESLHTVRADLSLTTVPSLHFSSETLLRNEGSFIILLGASCPSPFSWTSSLLPPFLSFGVCLPVFPPGLWPFFFFLRQSNLRPCSHSRYTPNYWAIYWLYSLGWPWIQWFSLSPDACWDSRHVHLGSPQVTIPLPWTSNTRKLINAGYKAVKRLGINHCHFSLIIYL